MENQTNKGDQQPSGSSLGRAFIAIGLLIVLAGLIFTSWLIGIFGAIVAGIGFAIGGTIQK